LETCRVPSIPGIIQVENDGPWLMLQTCTFHSAIQGWIVRYRCPSANKDRLMLCSEEVRHCFCLGTRQMCLCSGTKRDAAIERLGECEGKKRCSSIVCRNKILVGRQIWRNESLRGRGNTEKRLWGRAHCFEIGMRKAEQSRFRK